MFISVVIYFYIWYGEIEKNLGKMYDPIIGRYVLEHWDEVINVVKTCNDCNSVLFYSTDK